VRLRAEARKRELDDSDEEGFLRRRRVTSHTRDIYQQWVSVFEKEMGCDIHRLAPAALDRAVDAFLVRLYAAGEGVDSARHALYGIAWATTSVTRDPSVLPLSKASLQGFAKKCPPGTKDPAPWEAVLMAAHWLSLHRGEVGLLTAAFMLLSFDLYTRPSEALALEKGHVRPPFRRAHGAVQFWTVTIAPSTSSRTTKAGTQDDTVLLGSVGSERVWLKGVLNALYAKTRRAHDRLIPLELSTVEAEMRTAAKALLLQKLNMSPHTLRHGGPSHDLLAGTIDRAEVQARGHWLCAASVARYEKRGKLVRQLTKLPSDHQVSTRAALAWLQSTFLTKLRSL